MRSYIRDLFRNRAFWSGRQSVQLNFLIKKKKRGKEFSNGNTFLIDVYNELLYTGISLTNQKQSQLLPPRTI